MKVRWTTPALRDVESIGDYIAQFDQKAAARTVSAVFDAIDRLTDHPHIGRPGRVPETRELVIADTPFIAAYRVRDDALEILAVIHSSRQWPESF